jgi:hypothetical protein
MKIEWEDPPAIRYQRKPNKGHLRAAMNKNPGCWLVWSRNSTRANASNIRHRYPELEVEWRHNPSGEGVTIWTRLPLP